uniref:Uncharacterized protein n=1 Tax=Candidatus Kentrum sp. TUN TaxID=2126343 RepID=A0A450ZAF4_9GAMM|nr:MAG: hypothetical protein BECKTUN1418E_GA0071001_100447 [Candidatus Kentron sp. TUN]VFK52020.1 MAG: hypothetical protein BECKTUN1418F_GA0071002_100447 [Candidatus Kentron sp. TUN]
MLVYSNYLSLEGQDADKGVFSALAGWIKNKTETQLHPSALKGSSRFDLNDGMSVTTEKADLREPHLYSIVIKHPDQEINGRQWIIEVGIEANINSTNVSCVLKTDEISGLVSKEVRTTRPLFISYIIENGSVSKSTPRISVKLLEDNVDTYRALKFEIERKERDYPLVLVSAKKDGDYLNIDWLQKQLIGLAQVIVIPQDSDTYEMEEYLGKNYSAWNGAINIIYTPFKGGKVHNKLLRSNFIEEQPLAERISHILAIVTHNTNILNLRRQIRPEGVKLKSLKEKYISRSANASEIDKKYQKDIDDIWEMAASQEEEYKKDLDRLEFEKLSAEEDRDKKEEEIFSLNHKIDALQRRSRSSDNFEEPINCKDLFDFCCRSDEPSPEEVLHLVKSNFSKSCIILDSAIESAENVPHFKKGRRLLDMINRLISKYLPRYLEGGDNQARSIFTPREYSANESETVMSNQKSRKYRTFFYKGAEIQMQQHLRVGVTEDNKHTIRVHFSIDKEEKKVVIGHCGEHLPISNH